MKPRILDLYIAKKFIGTVVFILLITAVVSSVFDVAEKMDAIINNKISLGTVMFYYVNFIPTIINLTSPLLIFISALFFTARLANNSEIIAMLGTGISYMRMIRPYIAVGVALAFIDYGLKNFVLPRAAREVVNFELTYLVDNENFSGQNVHRQINSNTFFYAQSIDVKNQYARKFSIEKFDGENLVYKLTSADANFDSLSGTWRVNNYFVREVKGEKETITKGDSLRIKIPITIADFGQKVRTVPSMTTPELNDFIRSEKRKGESMIKFYLVEKYRRTAMPFAIIILVLIAVSLASKKVRGGMGMHLTVGILLAFSYELSMRFSTTFATNADLPPLVAVWLPNVLYTGIALYLLRRAQQ